MQNILKDREELAKRTAETLKRLSTQEQAVTLGLVTGIELSRSLSCNEEPEDPENQQTAS